MTDVSWDDPREISLRYAATCVLCRTKMAPRTRAIWDSSTKTARCLPCSVPAQAGPPPVEVHPVSTIDFGTPGASAQRLFDMKESRRRERLRRIWWVLAVISMLGAVVGGVVGHGLHTSVALLALIGAILPLLDLIKRPQHIDAWRVGASGERQVGQTLDRLKDHGVFAVHDRQVPGRHTNIDHIAVSPAGVFAIDTKNVAGKVAVSRSGLRVAGRRQDKMLEGVVGQIAVVQHVLNELGLSSVTARGVLCFTRANLPWFRPSPRGVALMYPRGLRRELTKASSVLSPAQVKCVAEALATRLPPA
jgi:hypothetical protein